LSSEFLDAQSVYSIIEVSPGNLMCSTGDFPGAVFLSNDDGFSWIPLNWSPTSAAVTKLMKDEDGRIYALDETESYSYKIWFSDDMGSSWQETPVIPGTQVFDFTIDEKNVVYVTTGNPGKVYRWARGDERWMEVGSSPEVSQVMSIISAPCTPVTPTPTFTPRPTPTPRPEGGTYSATSHDYFYAGERFLYVVDVYHYPERMFMSEMGNRFYLYVALEVYGVFYFYPSWTEKVECVELENLPPGATENISVFDFTWPDVDGSAMNLRLWSVILEGDSGEMYGRYDVTEFGYGPPPTATPTSIPTPTPVPPKMTVLFNNDDSPLSWTCGDERIYCFGTTHSSTGYYRVVTVKNEGGGVLNVETEISGSDADLFEMENGDSFSLQPGATREIRIRFSPEPPPGEKSAFLDITGADKTERMELRGGYSF